MPSTAATDFILGAPGMVFDYAGATAPAGFLLCYGQAISRTTYAKLFAAISTAFGVGDGSTTFNVPDCRGRVIAGKDDMGGAAASRLSTAGSGVDGAALGSVGGAENHTLITAEMPAHNHGVTDPTHNHSNVVSSNNGSSVAGGSQISGSSTVAIAAAATGISIQNTGSGSAHQNVQPTIVFNKIIKT